MLTHEELSDLVAAYIVVGFVCCWIAFVNCAVDCIRYLLQPHHQ